MSFHRKGEVFSMTSARVSVVFPLRMGVCKSLSLTVLWKKQIKPRNPPSSVFRMPCSGGFPNGVVLTPSFFFFVMKCLLTLLIRPAMRSLEVETSLSCRDVARVQWRFCFCEIRFPVSYLHWILEACWDFSFRSSIQSGGNPVQVRKFLIFVNEQMFPGVFCGVLPPAGSSFRCFQGPVLFTALTEGETLILPYSRPQLREHRNYLMKF